MLTFQAYQLSENKPKNAVILLHGYGANGADLLDLGESFSDSCPDTVFISPDAPYPCEMGGGGYQWFSLKEYTPASLQKGTREAFPYVKELIEYVMKTYGLKEKQIALVGFSQGTMMSLYTVTQMPEALACVVGYSGALPETKLADNFAYKDLPVCLIHGEEDSVVPVQATIMAANLLAKYGFDVTQTLVPNLGHGIDRTGLELGENTLKSILNTQ